jgi:hypothetical protein
MHVKPLMKILFVAIIISQLITIQVHCESNALIKEIITQNVYSVNTRGVIVIRATSNITIRSIDPVDKYSHYEFKYNTSSFKQGAEYVIVINGTIQRKKEESLEGFICEPALFNITVKSTSDNNSEYRLVLLTVCSSNFQYINSTLNNISKTASQINNNITHLRLIEVVVLALSIVSIGLLSVLLIMFKKMLREEVVFGL